VAEDWRRYSRAVHITKAGVTYYRTRLAGGDGTMLVSAMRKTGVGIWATAVRYKARHRGFIAMAAGESRLKTIAVLDDAFMRAGRRKEMSEFIRRPGSRTRVGGAGLLDGPNCWVRRMSKGLDIFESVKICGGSWVGFWRDDVEVKRERLRVALSKGCRLL